MNKCPLCESREHDTLEVINQNDLSKLYKKTTGVDFTEIINVEIKYKQCCGCGIKYFDPPTPGNQKFYETLQKFPWYYVDEKIEYEIAQKHIKENDIVLDVGCGKGAFSRYVEDSRAKFIGLEYSKSAKKIAAELGIEIRNESIEQYSIINPLSVDVVTSFQVAEHVVDVRSFIEAKIKTIKPGGKMILAVPSEDSFIASVTNSILNMPPHHLTRWTDSTFDYIAKKYKLKLIKVEHEKLQNTHARWYLITLIQNSITKPRLLDLSIKRRILSRIASILSRLMISGFNECMRPNGHTVVAIFQKTII